MGIGIRIENLRKVYDTPPPSAARGGGFSFTANGRPGPRRRKKKFEVVALDGISLAMRRRRGLRPAGAERRGEIDHHRRAHHAHPAHQRPRLHRRLRRLAGAGEGQAADRRGAAAAQSGFCPDGARRSCCSTAPISARAPASASGAPANCWRSSSSPTAPTTWCAASPAA